jgi:hypothetical protein
MAHSLAEIEGDALQLPAEDRARLAVDQASLEESVESPETHTRLQAESYCPRNERAWRHVMALGCGV